MERKQFTFYRSFWAAIEKLPQEYWLAYLVNIISYGLDQQLVMEMNSTQAGMFELVRPNLDSARKKAKAGAEGGRRKKASKQVSKKENENEIEIENELELENELEIELECESNKRLGAGDTHRQCRENFEKFWELYPLKLAKEEAWGVWLRKLPDTQQVCEAVRKWRNSRQWNQQGNRFVPRADNFLEQEYYLQAPEVESGATGKPGAAELEAIARLMKEN